ncbi:hypothetical protein ACFYUV_20725 [Nonomuraea sp. NPDC003560]|uniref:hypothetical protein n=1 Tax=Nonomuraea sp. NPDC003560 TaxID=3364341 RepID=UPI0036C1047E
MPTEHRLSAKAFRPQPDEYDPVKDGLAERQRTMDDFLRAFLRLAREDLDAALKLVEPHWPPAKPKVGRPRKTPPAGQ